MRTKVVYDVVEGYLQVVEHRLCLGLVIVVRHHFIEYAPVACFLDVCGNREYHPQRIVREVTADIGVALLGKRLILVIASAVRKLCGGNINDPLSCSVGYLVNEAEYILVGITEAHSSADT